MSNFWGQFFMFWGAKKILNLFWKYFSNSIDRLHKIALIFFFSFWKSLKKLEKLELSPQNFRYDVLHLLYSDIILFTEFLWVMCLSWFPYLLFQLCQESCPVCWIRGALLTRFSKALVVRGRRFSAFASVVGMTWRKFRHFLCHIGAFWLFLVRFPFYLTLFPPARAFFINVMVYHMTEPGAWG